MKNWERVLNDYPEKDLDKKVVEQIVKIALGEQRDEFIKKLMKSAKEDGEGGFFIREIANDIKMEG